MTFAHARRWSLVFALSVNAINAVVFLGLFASAVRQGATTSAIAPGVTAGAFAIGCWMIVATERRIQVRIATAESYLEEQRCDTQIKHAMVESFQRHGAALSFEGPLATKTKPN